jgi:hypothetical protein
MQASMNATHFDFNLCIKFEKFQVLFKFEFYGITNITPYRILSRVSDRLGKTSGNSDFNSSSLSHVASALV